MPRKLPSLVGRFDQAVTATDHAREVATLQAQIEELRRNQSPDLEKQLSVLRAQLEAQSGEQDISISLIDPNPSQPRQTIPLSSVRTLANTLDADGQITSIILIPSGERYLLWDGQRRWAAAKYLEWETIRAVIAPMPNDLHRQSLLTFVHHEDLNPLDKAEAIVKEVASAAGLEEEAIPVVLSTVLRRLERHNQVQQLNGLVSASREEQKKTISQLGIRPDEEMVLLSILELALYPPSVKSNLMSMLSLPLDLKTAIREKGLKAAHASALVSLSGKNLKVSERQARRERLDATERVLKEGLTVTQTREMLKQIKAKYIDSTEPSSKAIQSVEKKLEKLNEKNLKTASKEDLLALQRTLKSKLAQVEALL
ncbi:ParB-like nuclease domain family [Synechococcus sp. PCC 7335]|uniref:ParB/RepB/Spo0J family partition protein n=1 Tax=Synechococcus sp. (strain ATCC 29403 / PCC 7335) TaxID=91464 RepID=UPI00017EDA0A|nr:ParB/RepB/Spo0J family partition protein [Synechococcus sp. PCC 7335]EDX82759.1 ParB-like nuclease domain family [Synechococcus sp. PCC 7335]